MDNAQVGYRSSNPNIVQPIGDCRRRFPLPIDYPLRFSAYAFDVDMSCLINSGQNNTAGTTINFPPAALNAIATNAIFNMPAGSDLADANAILTNFGQPQDIGSGLGKFTASFNRVPASWDDFTTQEWTPPGWFGTPAGAAAYTARNPYPETVTVRLHYDYFIVDPNSVIPIGAGGILDSGGNPIIKSASTDSLLNGNIAAKIVTSASAIPTIQRAYFCNTLVNTGATPTPIYSSHVLDLVQSGGFQSDGVFYLETFPSIQAYQVWCANVQAFIASGGNPWNGTVWDGGNRDANGVAKSPYLDQSQSAITQMVLKDSILKPFAGNIWSRMTTYALFI
jgi:hypothetical protein